MFIESFIVGSVYLIALGIATVLYVSPINDEVRMQEILNNRIRRIQND
tara:strand:- start:658 stop:801 length:144 start_codon:yes stop_codon:yes gene_type:complete